MYYFGLMLSLSAIYMIAGCGAAYSLKAGRINLAGEGLIYLGGFLCAVLLDCFAKAGVPAFFAVSLAFIVCAAAGALILSFCEFLYVYKKADFLLTSFITSSAIIPLIDGLIAGPFRTKTGNLLATSYIAAQYRFTSILKPSPLNCSIFVAVALCVVMHFFFARTRFGKQTTIYGISRVIQVLTATKLLLLRLVRVVRFIALRERRLSVVFTIPATQAFIRGLAGTHFRLR